MRAIQFPAYTNADQVVGDACDEAARLEVLNAFGILDTEPETELDAVTLLAADRFDAPIAAITFVAADRQWFKARVGLDIAETERAISFCAHTIDEPDVFIVPDAQADERFRANPLVTGPPGIRFYAGAPLVTGGGHRLGALCVIDTRPRPAFGDREKKVLRLLARQVMTLLELRQLRRAERVSHLIGDTTSDAFVCCDLDNRIIHWNSAAEAMFGWSASEALGQSLHLIVPDRHHIAHNAGMTRLRRGEKPRLVGQTVEVPARRRDGAEVMTELSLGMWSDEQGGPAGFAAIIRDVTARKALEAEREDAKTRLAEQVAAIEASNDGIATTDSDGIFTFMNGAHATMFGFDGPGEIVGRHWSELYAPEDLNRLQREAFPILNSKGRWRGEATGRRKDGSHIQQEISLSSGVNGGLVCVTRDIGERLHADREKARLREQLLIAQRQEVVG